MQNNFTSHLSVKTADLDCCGDNLEKILLFTVQWNCYRAKIQLDFNIDITTKHLKKNKEIKGGNNKSKDNKMK